MDYSGLSTEQLFAALDSQLENESYYRNGASCGSLMVSAMMDSRRKIEAIRNELFKRGCNKLQLF